MDSFAPTIVLRAILAVTGEYARVVLPRTAAKRSVDDNMVALLLVVVSALLVFSGTRKN